MSSLSVIFFVRYSSYSFNEKVKWLSSPPSLPSSTRLKCALRLDDFTGRIIVSDVDFPAEEGGGEVELWWVFAEVVEVLQVMLLVRSLSLFDGLGMLLWFIKLELQ